MNLRIIPAHPTSPTVIFSLNWHNLPSSLPLPSFYSQHLSQCSEAGIPTPRNTLAMDKAVGFHLLLESVTFDLARLVVIVAWLDKRTEEWPIPSIEGLQKSLEDVLDCVRQSGEEAEKEKKAAQQQATAAKAAPASSSTSDIPSTAAAPAPANAQSARERRRTASGIFSSLVASFITPPATPDASNSNAVNIPAHLAHLPRRRSSKGTAFVGFVELYHAQHIMHPQNKREQFPPNTVPQSRFLRRQARAKLVDVFRAYVASRLTTAMRKSGILGEELKERGVLDDMDDEELEGVESGPMPGTSGFQAAGGYVAFMARSMLRNALAEQEKAKAAAAAAATSSDDSFSSSSEESLLLTPKNGSETSLPSSTDSKQRSAKSAPAVVAARRRSVPTPTPQARQIRQISSLLIGLTQKDKRTANDEREMLELVKERSLRRRYSLSEASSLNASTSRIRIGNLPADWNKPVVPSPLRNVEVAEPAVETKEEEITVVLPFPTDAHNSVAEGADSGAANVSVVARRTQSLPTPPPASLEEAVDALEDASDSYPASKPKAAEAEDVLSNAPSRQRRTAILTSQSASAQPSSSNGVPLVVVVPSSPPTSVLHNAEQDASASDLIAIRSLPGLPSPKYTEFPEEVYSGRRFPEDVDCDEDEEGQRVSPPPMYAPTLEDAPSDSTKQFRGGEVKGLGLDTKGAQTYWSPVSDGIYVS
ncbi:hypothetical protein FS837_003425 [Tulasnella sp. UAMH 9824]|nr:hypothetical protein FS837_003425 [Tulasnella sp. UAMH 9824]